MFLGESLCDLSASGRVEWGLPMSFDFRVRPANLFKRVYVVDHGRALAQVWDWFGVGSGLF